jgi:hypothetical protein
MATVSIRDVRKRYGSTEVPHGVSVEIDDGKFVILVGPSGCGKSTLPRMIAGLENITGGEIAIGGRVVNDVAPKERDIAMVFQNYALYPTFLIPFRTWLLIGYFKSIPYELEECVLIDGASRLQILWRITLPLAVPGLISAGIFAFTLSWNEFIYALAFIQSTEKKTLPVAFLTELVTGDVYQRGSLMAGSLPGSVPVAIIYSFFVEYYVSSMACAVKE